MKFIKQPKRHIVPDNFERRALVKGINEYRKQVIDEGGCVEVVNELLIRIVGAPTKRAEISSARKNRENTVASGEVLESYRW